MQSLHTTRTYKVQYGTSAICGWDGERGIKAFIEKLRELKREPIDHDIYINEEETEIELGWDVVRLLMEDETWHDVAETIWDECDHDNCEAHLDIW